jgi:hypothetical protein
MAAADRSWLSDGVVPQPESAVAGCCTPRARPSIDRTSLTNENAGTGGRPGRAGESVIAGSDCVEGIEGVEGIDGIDCIEGIEAGSLHEPASGMTAPGSCGIPGGTSAPPIHGIDWTPGIAGDIAAADRSWLSDGVVPHPESADAGGTAVRPKSSIDRRSLTNENAGTGGTPGMAGESGIAGGDGIPGIEGIDCIEGVEGIPGMCPGSAISLVGSVP